MSSKLFGFYLESGLLLKNLADILLQCSEKMCAMDITESTIDFVKLDRTIGENECKVLIRLDTSHLSSFYLLNPMTISLHVKYFNKLCKTLKKKDKVTVWVDKESLHIETKEEIIGIQKIEEKEMPITILYDCKPTEMPDINSYFHNIPFTISPTLIQGIRKSVGTKAFPVEVKINGDKYLEFDSTWLGTGPLKTVLGERSPTYTTIIVSAGVISILSKLSQLCNKLKFYHQKEEGSVKVLKVTGKLDTPYYLGDVYVLIKEISKKQ